MTNSTETNSGSRKLPTSDEVRGYSDQQLAAFIRAYDAEHFELMNQAEAIMEKTRPIGDLLFVARALAIERGVPV